MNRLSYDDLAWTPAWLQPDRYTEENGLQIQLNTHQVPAGAVSVDRGLRRAVVSMPPGQGKVSDAGYDQAACLAAAVPACGHLAFRAAVRILRLPDPEEQNGQEALGLFFRDTLAADPLNGYPYANMAAAGVWQGKPGVFGREGILPGDIEHVRSLAYAEASADAQPLNGKNLTVSLEMNGSFLDFRITAEDGGTLLSRRAEVDADMFSARDKENIYLGFLAARGCALQVDLDTVAVEYDEKPDVKTAILHAAPSGNHSGDGTEAFPLDLQSAVDRCRSGDRIVAHAGRYIMREDLVIPAGSGKTGMYRTLAADGSGPVILDFCGGEHGFIIEGDCWKISGITVTGGRGFMIQGSHNRIRGCQAAANRETGFLIRHPSINSPKELWPSYNELSDCVSCLNEDRSQQHADGFACKIAAGEGNRLIRCTAWMNSDDGFDLFAKNRDIGSVRLEECRSYLNGYVLKEGKPAVSRGNGNGFKLGGSGLAADHEAAACTAAGNRGFGFTSNSDPHMRLTACHAENNSRNYVYYYTGPQAQALRVQENCTERSDPDFDPAAFARDHIVSAEADPFLPVWQEYSSARLEQAVRALRDHGVDSCSEQALRNMAEPVVSLLETLDDDRPRILIMCSSLYGGGAERVACRLACGLSEHYRVIMLYYLDKGQTYPLVPAVNILRLPRFPGSYEEAGRRMTAFTGWLKDILDIRVSISFMFMMNKLNSRSAGKAAAVCSERNNPAKRDPLRLAEIAGFYEAADHVVFQTETVRSLFSEKVREHSSVILNPVSVTCERTGGSRRIVNIGRLIPQKNQALLIRAFALFHADHPEYTLSIYGEGELADELAELAASLGVNDCVHFHGQVQDVHAAAADAEMFVLSSDYEGLSNALLECMMMGFPCISTRCEGSVDIIQTNRNGILVDIGDEEHLREAMVLLADDAGLREEIGRQAKLTSRQFRTENVLRQWEQLIARLAASV
ncbi:MAG: glycosyltransferase [Solobacterium sp.]|nr:glycosyltransferase [Solobacterium sp.]